MNSNSNRLSRAQRQQIEIAAKAGDSVAMCQMGNLSINYNDAFYWYHKAADAGSVEGIYRLGYSYETGSGCSMDKNAALECYNILISHRKQLSPQSQIWLKESYYRSGVIYDKKLRANCKTNKIFNQISSLTPLEYYISATDLGHKKAALACAELYKFVGNMLKNNIKIMTREFGGSPHKYKSYLDSAKKNYAEAKKYEKLSKKLK